MRPLDFPYHVVIFTESAILLRQPSFSTTPAYRVPPAKTSPKHTRAPTHTNPTRPQHSRCPPLVRLNRPHESPSPRECQGARSKAPHIFSPHPSVTRVCVGATKGFDEMKKKRKPVSRSETSSRLQQLQRGRGGMSSLTSPPQNPPRKRFYARRAFPTTLLTHASPARKRRGRPTRKDSRRAKLRPRLASRKKLGSVISSAPFTRSLMRTGAAPLHRSAITIQGV